MPDNFYIAAPNSGLVNNVKSFLIPDDAFEQLDNAYVFRGRVRKRFGSYLMNGSVADSVAQQYSRLRVQVGTVGAPISPVPGNKFNVGQMFSVGDQFFTVVTAGIAQPMLATGPGAGTFDTTNGAFVIAGTGLPGATPIYWYPAEPVMGLITYQTPNINDELLYAFDTQFAYQFINGAWERLGNAVWTGTNAQFFWGWNYRGTLASNSLLFVTNYNAPDLIKYWDGAAWTNFNPLYNATQTIRTARIIVPFKDRLVLLNTVETVGGIDTTFSNRCRFSQYGDPIAVDSFREDIPGRGGFIDAPTKEQIVTAMFLKDRLIVYFESSTWELVFTQNQVSPFVWQQINTELGVESTFSIVPFDKIVLGIGSTGVHACSGTNVERIDDKIPDEVFNIHNENDGVYRVAGIRDYFTELVYWSMPSSQENPSFPNRVLVFNYKNGSWAFNDDSITAFGYFNQQADLVWGGISATWEESLEAWNSATLQGKFRQVVAGNQEGFIFVVDADESRNAPALQITNMTNTGQLTIINHNLNVEDFIIIENAQGITTYNNKIYQVDTVIDVNNISINEVSVGVYTGGGTVARVSRIDILTKQYNFYADRNKNISITKMNCLVDKTENGQVTVDGYISSSDQPVDSKTLETFPYPINLAPMEQTQQRLWHIVYPSTLGEYVQFRIYLSDIQITDPLIAFSDFQLNAIIFQAMPVGRLQ